MRHDSSSAYVTWLNFRHDSIFAFVTWLIYFIRDMTDTTHRSRDSSNLCVTHFIQFIQETWLTKVIRDTDSCTSLGNATHPIHVWHNRMTLTAGLTRANGSNLYRNCSLISGVEMSIRPIHTWDMTYLSQMWHDSFNSYVWLDMSIRLIQMKSMSRVAEL